MQPRQLAEAEVVGLIRAGRFTAEIAVAAGRSNEGVRYIAAKYGLQLASRYQRIRSGGYWKGVRGQYWRTIAAELRLKVVRLNTQPGMALMQQHGSEAPCSPPDTCNIAG